MLLNQGAFNNMVKTSYFLIILDKSVKIAHFDKLSLLGQIFAPLTIMSKWCD